MTSMIRPIPDRIYQVLLLCGDLLMLSHMCLFPEAICFAFPLDAKFLTCRSQILFTLLSLDEHINTQEISGNLQKPHKSAKGENTLINSREIWPLIWLFWFSHDQVRNCFIKHLLFVSKASFNMIFFSLLCFSLKI
jgi:hypothetical protein